MEEIKDKGPEAEKYIYNLSRDKLLEKYCFLNPIILNTDNKELCDLLILINNSCIIISIKNHAFTGNYERFNKQVFEKSKKQLLGAKRKLILNSPCHLSDKKGQQQLIDFMKINEFILITLNFGHQLNNYKIIEKEKNTTIHNIDKETFETIIFEIDSVPEITEYFIRKEALFKNYKSFSISGQEKDLLAWFVTNKREFPKEWTKNESDHLILNIEGRWNFYNNSEQTIEKRKANKISYFVDELVKKEITNLPQCAIIGDYLMGLSRVERRLFAMTFFEHCIKYKDKTKEFLSRRLLLNTFHDASCLMLYYVSSFSENELDEYLKVTGEIYLYVNQNHQKKLVLIATTKDYSKFKFGYLERTAPYSIGEVKYYEKIIKAFGWFTSQSYSEVNVKEYPGQKNK